MNAIELRKRGRLDPSKYPTGLLAAVEDETEQGETVKLTFADFGAAAQDVSPQNISSFLRVPLVEYDANNLPSRNEDNLLSFVEGESRTRHSFDSGYFEIEVVYEKSTNIIPYLKWLDTDENEPFLLNHFRYSDSGIWRVSDNAFRINFSNNLDTLKIYGIQMALTRENSA